MSSHDDDNLDFDFFDDDATREAPGAGRADAPQRPPGGGGGGGGPRRPQFQAPHGVTPILRLIGFVAFAILIVVLLVLWAQGCSGDKKRERLLGRDDAARHDRLQLGQDRLRAWPSS